MQTWFTAQIAALRLQEALLMVFGVTTMFLAIRLMEFTKPATGTAAERE
jgi:hypothetical protein